MPPYQNSAGDKASKYSRRNFFDSRSQSGGIAGVIFISSFAGLVILVLGALLINDLNPALSDSMFTALRVQAVTIARDLSNNAVIDYPSAHIDAGMVDRSLQQLLDKDGGSRAIVFDTNENVIADSAILLKHIDVKELPPISSNSSNASQKLHLRTNYQEGINKEINLALAGKEKANQRLNEDGDKIVSYSMPIIKVSKVVGVLTIESSKISDIVNQQRRALIPFIVAAVLANLVSASALAWVIARPLQRLAIAADNVRSGRATVLDEPEFISRPDEIGDLAEALSAMTKALQERIDANESFAADVAHEIKNPLASIRNATELLRLDTINPEQRKRLDAIVTNDLSRIDRLVTDISNASRLDAELARKNRDIISIRSLIENLMVSYKDLLIDRNINVSMHFNAPIDSFKAKVREDAINRVIINLLENAASFSPPRGTIRIIGKRINDTIRIIIEDEGIGIPEEALSKIFQRFYTQRPREQAAFGVHSGLGLAIARQIVESHNGRLWAQNRKNGNIIEGARFIMELPSASE